MTLTVTSKTTRAELAAEVERLHAERKRTVDVAFEMKRRHGLCDVVDRALVKAGLADLLPMRVVLQRKTAGNRAWMDEDDFVDTESGRSRALSRGRRLRNDFVKEEGRRYLRSLNYGVNRAEEYFNTTITPSTNVDSLLATLRRKSEVVKAEAKRQAELLEKNRAQKPPVRAYPQYRVILRKPGKVAPVEVLARFNQDEVVS